jgi:hypothetical protein
MKLLALTILLIPVCAFAQTPKLNVRMEHNSSEEQVQKHQLEEFAKHYDLSKYTITRDIVINQFAANHSFPVLTLNLRFLGNEDDRSLSFYVHEQAHWLLMTRYRRQTREMVDELINLYPKIDFEPPRGDGNLRSSYAHMLVIMLEWQAMENLIGVKRARAVEDFKRHHHYTDLFATVIDHRQEMEALFKRYDVKW